MIDTAPVDAQAAAAIEAAEARAWTDVYSAAPAESAAEVGLGFREVAGALVIQWAATGRRYFSRAIGLGVIEPASGKSIDEILRGWEEAGISMFLLQSLPHCRPEGYEDLLRERGLEPFDAQDRVVRDGSPLEPAGDRRLPVERVTPETADEWAEFVQRVYRLDTGPWLQRLIGRPGWPPGNSQGDGCRAPMVAWPLRLASTVRAIVATGSGRWMGTRPRRRRTPSSPAWIWPVVIWLIAAAPWA